MYNVRHRSLYLIFIFFSPVHAASPGSDLDLSDIRTQLRLLSLIDNPATVVAAAAARDADVVREYLTRNPQDVGHACISSVGDVIIGRVEFDGRKYLSISEAFFSDTMRLYWS